MLGWTNSFTSNNCSNSKYLYKIMQLLGDPELSIHTEDPVTMNITHNTSIPTGTSDFNVNATDFPDGEDITATLFKENEVYAFSETNTGEVTFEITPDTQGEMKLTVTCHNAEPYESMINVSQNPGVHLYKNDLTINDENSNGIVEPGEPVNLLVELRNSGGSNSSNVTGELTTKDENTEISQNTSAYPDISSEQTGVSINNYTFNVGTDDMYHGKAIPFELAISSSQGDFTENFFLNVKNSELEPGNRSVLVNGMETNTFNPGDIVELYVDIHNYGSVTANNITGDLSTNLEPKIVKITDGNQNYGDIESFTKETNTNPFILEIGPDYSNEDLIFNLTLTDNFDFTHIFEFEITEEYPVLITKDDFDFSSGNNYIKLDWSGIDDIDNIKGFNIFRSNTEAGSYEKINQFLVTGTPIYYDADVEEHTAYYYKISAVSITGNERNLDELVNHKAWTSLEFHSGYPIKAHQSAATSNRTSVTVADVDYNGKKELFPAYTNNYDGKIMGFYESGQELFNIDGNETTVSGFTSVVLPEDNNGNTNGGELWSKSSVGDINNDGSAEVFVTTNGNYYAPERGYLFGFKTIDENNDNKPDPLWNGEPIDLGHRSMSSPVIADIDADGASEIIVNQESQKIMVFDSNGSLIWAKEIDDSPWYSYGYLAVADLNDNGYKEIVIGTKSPGAIYIYNYDGTDFNSTNPIYEDASLRFDTNPVIADIDNDNQLDIVIIGRNNNSGFLNSGFLYAFHTDGSFVTSNWDGSIELNFKNNHPSTPQVAIGDLNANNNLEIVVAGKKKLNVFDNSGTSLNSFPIEIDNLNTGRRSPVLADIDNDVAIEIIVTFSNNRIYAFNPDASECVGWRLNSHDSEGFAGTPCISDINNDGANEVIISNKLRETYVWETTGDADKIEWGSYRGNAQNTGVYNMKCNFSPNNIEITESGLTWNSNRHIRGHLILKENSDLTIHSKVTFVKESKVIIEPGAKLTIDGGKLTNICGSLWQGIQVWGHSDSSQFSYNGPCPQGKLEIINGGTIENAEIGVNLWHPDHWNSTGGIVQAEDAVFRNNAKAVHAFHYHNYFPTTPEREADNLSHFTNCTFEITDDYPGTTTFYKHVDLADVRGIDFEGCDFSVDDQVNGVSTWNSGIAAYDAVFDVEAA